MGESADDVTPRIRPIAISDKERLWLPRQRVDGLAEHRRRGNNFRRRGDAARCRRAVAVDGGGEGGGIRTADEGYDTNRRPAAAYRLDSDKGMARLAELVACAMLPPKSLYSYFRPNTTKSIACFSFCSGVPFCAKINARSSVTASR